MYIFSTLYRHPYLISTFVVSSVLTRNYALVRYVVTRTYFLVRCVTTRTYLVHCVATRTYLIQSMSKDIVLSSIFPRLLGEVCGALPGHARAISRRHPKAAPPNGG